MHPHSQCFETPNCVKHYSIGETCAWDSNLRTPILTEGVEEGYNSLKGQHLMSQRLDELLQNNVTDLDSVLQYCKLEQFAI